LSQCAQGLDGDLAIDLSGIETAMAKNLIDLHERGSSMKHVGGQSVSQQMRSFAGWMKSCSIDGLADNGRDVRRTGKSSMRRIQPHKDVAR
jgi:hypothetical protein